MKVVTSRVDDLYQISIKLKRGNRFGLYAKIDTQIIEHDDCDEMILTTKNCDFFLIVLNEIFSHAQFQTRMCFGGVDWLVSET
jgi:hypothetical protein